MRKRQMLLPFLASALLASCTSAGAASPRPSGQAPSAWDGPSPAGLFFPSGTYVSTSVQGHDLVAGSKVTLTFKDGQLTANAGCNTMGGQAAVVGDGTLQVNSMASTEMGCAADLMAQDAWLAAFLPGAKADVSPQAMTLSKGVVTLSLVARQSTSLPLEGTTWTVDGLVGGDSVSSVPAGVTATLVIRGREAQIYTGCNSGSIVVTVAEGTITFSPVSMTAMGCTDGAKPVEQAVLAVMEGVQPYRIDGGSLTIGASGKAGLTLKGTAASTSAAPS